MYINQPDTYFFQGGNKAGKRINMVKKNEKDGKNFQIVCQKCGLLVLKFSDK